MTVKTYIARRGDTAADWGSNNTVLRDRQLGFETDTNRWKLGDGVTAWNALQYGGGVPPVDNMAALIAINVQGMSSGQYVETGGFYTAGDGGGGKFRWNATASKTTHNGGTIIDPDIGVTPGATGWWTAPGSGIGVWEMVYSSDINVKWFGAKGDSDSSGSGGSNDTSPINAAISTSLLLRANLHFGKGFYYYSGTGGSIPVSYDFKITGSTTGVTEIFVDADGVIFNVTSSTLGGRRFFVHDIRFRLLNPAVNTNATLFYVSNGTIWGSHFAFERCWITQFTNCAVHGIRAYNSGFRDTNIIGVSNYTDSSGLLPTYDDAGVRLWGADGTLTVQSHTWSGQIFIDDCYFAGFRYCVDGWNIFHGIARNSTFQAGYVNIINRKNPTPGVVGNVSSLDKGGQQLAAFYTINCWLEQSAKWYFSGIDIDPTTGNYVNPSLISSIKTKYVYYQNIAKVDAHILDNQDNARGVWAPVLSRQNNGVYDTTASGTWVRSGELITCEFQITVNSVTTQGSRFLRVGGIPFTVDTGGGGHGVLTNQTGLTGDWASAIRHFTGDTLFIVNGEGQPLGETGQPSTTIQAGEIWGSFTFIKQSDIP